MLRLITIKLSNYRFYVLLELANNVINYARWFNARDHECSRIMTNYMFYWIVDKVMNLVFSLNYINLIICYELIRFDLTYLSIKRLIRFRFMNYV